MSSVATYTPPDDGFMMPNITRGSDPKGLLRYLFGKGRHNEHRDQHLVGASRDMQEGFGCDGRPTKPFSELAVMFDRRYRDRLADGRTCPPDRRGGKNNPDRLDGLDRVWHCSLAIRAGEGILTDAQWESIVRDFLQRMGMTDEDGEGVTWVAVRHGLSRNGNDHVHLVVQLAKDDGWFNPFNDRRKAQRACRAMERERDELVELGAVLDRDHIRYSYREWREWAEWKARQDYQGPTPWEDLSQDERFGLCTRVMTDTMPRYAIGRIVRACAKASRSEDEFIRRVRREGLSIDPRLRKGVGKGAFTDRSQVVGYTVTWRSADGWRERLNATDLGPDMRLRELRKTWSDNPNDSSLAVAEWRAAMENRRPAMRQGRERRLDALTTHDMSVLVDKAWRIARSIDTADGQERDRAIIAGLHEFDRILDRYGLDGSDVWPMAMGLEQGTMTPDSGNTIGTPGRG